MQSFFNNRILAKIVCDVVNLLDKTRKKGKNRKRILCGGVWMDYRDYVEKIRALADETRIQILDIIACEEKNACEILTSFAITQPTLSHHMKILVDAKLVIAMKKGRSYYYQVNQKMIDDICLTTQKFASKIPVTRKAQSRMVLQEPCEDEIFG